MSQVRNRFFLIAFCVALVLVVVPVILSAMGLRDLVREGIQTVASPFQWCVTKAYDGVAGFVAYFTEYDRLVSENEALREQLRQYEDAAYENEVLSAENRWLREYLSLKNEHIDYTFVDAAVVGRESNNVMTVISLNRGTAHGISVGMPVITENGVFGYVKEVSKTSCKVVSIVETATAVGAFIERSGVTGLVEGDYTLRMDGKVVLKNIPQTADVKVGDPVYTSGTGSVYPRGLLIGTVESVSADPYSRTLTAVILPKEDFLALDHISHLMIVTGYEVYAGSASETETAANGSAEEAVP